MVLVQLSGWHGSHDRDRQACGSAQGVDKDNHTHVLCQAQCQALRMSGGHATSGLQHFSASASGGCGVRGVGAVRVTSL